MADLEVTTRSATLDVTTRLATLDISRVYVINTPAGVQMTFDDGTIMTFDDGTEMEI